MLVLRKKWFGGLYILLANLFAIQPSFSQTPTPQDCLGSIAICQDVLVVPSPYPYFGSGNYFNEINQALTCYTDDNNCVWYNFTIQTAGIFRFSLTPTNGNTDFDWTLFDLTNGSCSDLAGSNVSSYVVSSNTYGAWGFNGATGISTPNGGTGNCNGPGTFNGPIWNADLNVTAGTVLYLCISNWSSYQTGYTLDFTGSTAQLYNSNLDVNLTGTDLLCYDECNGSVQASGVNGIPPYTYEWDGGSNNPSQTNLCADTYTVTITDAGGCESVDSIEITEPSETLISFDTVYNVSCPGVTLCNGGAEAVAVGGTGPYAYQWENGEPTAFATALCPGNNWVYVTDANGCYDSAFVFVDTPMPIQTFAAKDTLICITNDASIIATSTGGTAPFNYVWRSGSLSGPVVSTNAVDLVSPETTTTYFVSSTDVNGCTGDTSKVTISVRPPLGNEITPPDTICVNDTIRIRSIGSGGDSIYTYAWDNGTINEYSFVTSDVSKYIYVTVSDACGSPSIVDSVWLQVGGYPSISAIIRVEDDSICVGDGTYMTVNGAGGYKGPNEYRYTWSTGSQSDFIEVTPEKTTTYTVTINDLCQSKKGVDTITVHVGNYAKPAFYADPRIVCSPGYSTISLENFNPTFSYSWGFGDGTSVVNFKDKKLLHKFDSEGCQEVYLKAVTDFGCVTEVAEPCLLECFPTPVAAFENSPESPSSLHPLVEFRELSKNEDMVMWQIDGMHASSEPVFIYTFPDTGAYNVQLIAMNNEGCADTVNKVIGNPLQQTIYLPTSFTPNGDGLNDYFGVNGEGINPKGFEIVVYDRWGGIIFESTDPKNLWDGRDRKGNLVPIATYPYTIKFLDGLGTSQMYRGQVTIPRQGNRAGN